MTLPGIISTRKEGISFTFCMCVTKCREEQLQGGRAIFIFIQFQTSESMVDWIHYFGAVVRKNAMAMRLYGRGSWSPLQLAFFTSQ